MGRHVHNARETILDAAEEVVIETGARYLTLDAVAAKAGVSRGGLIYHFQNKEALLHAMLDRRLIRIEENRQRRRALLQKGPRGEIIAYVLSSLEQDDKTKKLSVALLAAVVHDPRLLLPNREKYKRFLDEFSRKGIGIERAAIIMLAVNGLRLRELLSLSPFTAEERRDVIEEIITLAKDEKDD